MMTKTLLVIFVTTQGSNIEHQNSAQPQNTVVGCSISISENHIVDTVIGRPKLYNWNNWEKKG